MIKYTFKIDNSHVLYKDLRPGQHFMFPMNKENVFMATNDGGFINIENALQYGAIFDKDSGVIPVQLDIVVTRVFS
jgi:hypothetical protein